MNKKVEIYDYIHFQGKRKNEISRKETREKKKEREEKE